MRWGRIRVVLRGSAPVRWVVPPFARAAISRPRADKIAEGGQALLAPDPWRISTNALGETNIPKVRQLNERHPTMGDRSPKSVQKKASQKQSKTNVSNQRKQALVSSQQATKAKAAAAKRK